MRLVAALSSWCLAQAQAQTLVSFYHGRDGDSKVVGATATDSVTGRRQFTWEQRSGSEVCVRVLNANPARYSYMLNAEVDTSTPKLPQLPSGLAEGITSIAEAYSSTARSRNIPAVNDSLIRFADLLDSLAFDLLRADSIVTDADSPELLAEVLAAAQSPVGFRHAKVKLAQLQGVRGRFNDRKLSETIGTWASAARRVAQGNPVAMQFATALGAFGETLISRRDAIQASYITTSAEVRTCAKVGNGNTTITLKVARRDSTAIRDTGSQYFTTVVKPTYERGTVEITAAAFMGIATGISSFSVVNDTVRETRGSVFPVRVGAVFLYNAVRFGSQGEGALGIGLGFGFLGEKKALSDVFGTGVLSYRDMFRIGFGLGRSTVAGRLKAPASIGAPLPPNAGKLEDLVESRGALAGYIVFQIAGLDLMKK